MGLSSNQARFLSLTARQIDVEHRIQQICQRRLRLSSELENVATAYNNKISNRKFYTNSLGSHPQLSFSTLKELGYDIGDMTQMTLYGVHNMPFETLDATEMAAANPGEIAATGANATMVNLVNSTSGLGFVTHLTTQRQADGTYMLQPTTSVAISSEAALKTLMTSAFNNNEGLDLNYILMNDMDMSSFAWNSIGDDTHAFTGTFDGNNHTISNMTINANSGYQGMFANLEGTAKNIYLNNTSININGGANTIRQVGSIAGATGSNGQILNCHSANINIDIDSTYNPPSDNGNCSTQNIGGITGTVLAGGIVDISTVSGTIDLRGSMGIDQTGGFIGSNASNAKISMSGADVDILVPSAAVYQDCESLFMGCDYAPGLIIDNCYATGQIIQNGTPISKHAFGHGTDTKVINSYASDNGTAHYWNDTVTGSNWATSSTTMGGGFATSTAPNGQKIWDLSGSTPKLNLSAISTYVYDGGTPTENELNEGLRNGTLSILKTPDMYTQQTTKFGPDEYEIVDWRTMPLIGDELFKADDKTAEDKYEKTIEEINSQDKKLQLEQTSIEVQYKAISSEKEAVKKILDTNAQSSFKYFS